MQISVIEPSGRLYGSEFCLLDIVTGLPQSQFGWRVLLPEGNGFDKLLLDAGVPCRFLIHRRLGELPMWRRALGYLRILAHLCAQRPDLLYVNQAGALRAAAVYARILRLPIVCQVQTLEDARWLSTRPELHRNVYAFVCNSSFIAAHTKVPKDRRCTLYQGIPKGRAERSVQFNTMKCTEPAPGKPTFGILGRIAKSKGHWLLLEAMQALGDRLKESTVRVIGEALTPAETRDYKDAVRAAGLEDRFCFRGYRSDLDAELASVDVLLVPSIAEPLGRVLFDAAEYGVPVILSDAGGLGELGQRFSIGALFASGDPAALADAMVDFAADLPSRRAAFAQAAPRMLRQLEMEAYLKEVGKILAKAAAREPASVGWFGVLQDGHSA